MPLPPLGAGRYYVFRLSICVCMHLSPERV